MTDLHMTRLMELPGFPELSEDARNLARNSDMAVADWDSPGEASFDYLWAACMVLRSYESPSWGNTGGRYGHSLGVMGQLDTEWLAGLTEGELEDWCEYQEDYARDFLGDPFAAWTFAKWADEHGETVLVELADWLSGLIEKYPVG